MLSYTLTKEDENIIFNFDGSFTVGEIGEIFTKIENEIKSFRIIIFNFSEVNFIDSYGIGQLVAFYKRLQSEKKSFKICAINQSIKDIFNRLNVSNFFEIYETCDEALAL